MSDTNDPRYNTGNPVFDALRFLADASFAILPRDTAQKIGELEKNFWGGVRWFAEKNAGWIDESLAAADRLRAEWNARCRHDEATPTPEPPPQSPPAAEGI